MKKATTALDARDKRAALRRYRRRLQQFGVGEKALGWGPKGRSSLRNEILLSRWDLKHCSILDFGCGFGSLLPHLKARGVKEKNYLGIDINPDLIARARRLHPKARFEVVDILREGKDLSADYVLSSGVFNHKLRDNDAFIAACFKRFDRIARRGFAVNFLSSRVEYRKRYTHHSDPARILNLAYRFSNNVVLRNDYMPYEFTVFVDKAAAVDKKLAVYEDYRALV